MSQRLEVCLGEEAVLVGTLGFEARGARRSTSFAYAPQWLARSDRFALSPDLPLVSGHQFRANKDPAQSIFFSCFADTEPDGWGRMVIQRDHARQRREGGPSQVPAGPLNELDFLLWVSDYSRMGALRLRDEQGVFHRAATGRGQAPVLVQLPQLLAASKAVEENKETARDLAFLRGNGTSLGGLRPKCAIIDADGALAIGKFPSVQDTRSIVHGEVLALQLATRAGINAAPARVIDSGGVAVAVIRRFDRQGSKRIPYLSARSLLQAAPAQQYSYVDIADALRVYSSQAAADLQELWRRMVFNILINNVDDHLNNHGFLHQAHGQWRLAPAFDINPFPDKERTLKTWISQDAGDIASLASALAVAPVFGLTQAVAAAVLAQVKTAVADWKATAHTLGMSPTDVQSYAPAFEHPEL